jgi:hypothetical protein
MMPQNGSLPYRCARAAELDKKSAPKLNFTNSLAKIHNPLSSFPLRATFYNRKPWRTIFLETLIDGLCREASVPASQPASMGARAADVPK